MHPHFVLSNNPVKHIIFFICFKVRPIRLIFSPSFSSLCTHSTHTFRKFKWSRIMLYAKQWEHPSAVATLSIVNLLSVRINSSIRCTGAYVAISTGRPARALSATFEILWENFSTPLRQKLPTINRKYFFMNILCIESFYSQKNHNGTLLFGSILLKHGRHFDHWNQPLNMRNVRLIPRLCCYLVIHIQNLVRPLQLFYYYFLLPSLNFEAYV
jgi:hypothetical protein